MRPGEIALTYNGVSIYFVAQEPPDQSLHAIAADTNHSLAAERRGEAAPEIATVINAMMFKHTKYPNAAKEYLRFMMEAPQYGPWLTECFGYWAQPLKAYSKMRVWTADPKLEPYRDGMDTPYYDGYMAPVSSASSAVSANYILVDMFAAVATGDARARRQRQSRRRGRPRATTRAERPDPAGRTPAAARAMLKAGPMDATVQTWTYTRPKQTTLGRVFDSKPFLVTPVHVAHGGAAADFPDLPARPWRLARLHRRHDRPARALHRSREFHLARKRSGVLARGVPDTSSTRRPRRSGSSRSGCGSRCC